MFVHICACGWMTIYMLPSSGLEDFSKGIIGCHLHNAKPF